MASEAWDPADKPGKTEGEVTEPRGTPLSCLTRICLSSTQAVPADMTVCPVSSFDWYLQYRGSKEPPAFQELFSSGLAELSPKHIYFSFWHHWWEQKAMERIQNHDVRARRPQKGRGQVEWFRAWVWGLEWLGLNPGHTVYQLGDLGPVPESL